MKTNKRVLTRIFTALAVGLTFGAVTAQAQVTVSLQRSTESVTGSANDDWMDAQATSDGASYWSNNAAPSSGNDYVVNGLNLRTPDNNSTGVANFEFAGDSLTFTGGGTLYYSSKDDNLWVNNLTFDGGTFTNGRSGGTDIGFDGQGGNASTINIGAGGWTIGGQAATMNLESALTGSGAITLNGGSGITALFNNVTTWSGDFNLVAGELRFNDNVANGGDFANNGGRFVVTGANDHVFNSLTVDGTAIAAGTYTANDLKAIYGSTRFDGAGTIEVLTVVPEPSTIILVGLGLLAVTFRRRRSF